jgi:hypothetical protein
MLGSIYIIFIVCGIVFGLIGIVCFIKDQIDTRKGKIENDTIIVGGFHTAQDRTLDLLAKACKERNINEVQRLAKMTLTWWSGK